MFALSQPVLAQDPPSAEIRVGNPTRDGQLKLRLQVTSVAGGTKVTQNVDFTVPATKDMSRDDKRDVAAEKATAALKTEGFENDVDVVTAPGGRVVFGTKNANSPIQRFKIQKLSDTTGEHTHIDNPASAPSGSSASASTFNPNPGVDSSLVGGGELWFSLPGAFQHVSSKSDGHNTILLGANNKLVEEEVRPTDRVVDLLVRMQLDFLALGQPAQVAVRNGRPTLILLFPPGVFLVDYETDFGDLGVGIALEEHGDL